MRRENLLYFDHQLTTQPAEGVIEKMAPYFQIKWHSSAAPYTVGESFELALKESYTHIYELLGALDEDHFVFTSSGAEAVNHVVMSAYIDVTRKTGKNHFLATALNEAPSILSLD